MKYLKYPLLFVMLTLLFAACNQTQLPEMAEEPELQVTAETCPNTGTGDPAWTKIDSGSSLAVVGEFGQFSYSGKTLEYAINDGYKLEFCIKSGSQVGTIYREVTGLGTITIAQDISHVSWRILVKSPPLKELVDLTVEKTATASYERLVEWDLTKTVNGQESASFTGKPGNTFSATWEVVATKTTDRLQNYSITGDIKVTNPNPVAVAVSVDDKVNDGTQVSLECPSNTVPAESSLTCTYKASPDNMDAKLNTVTVTVDQDSYVVPAGYKGKIEGGKATADVIWGDPVLIGDPSPLLKDLRPIFDYSEYISGTTTLMKTETFTCPEYSAEKYPNDTYYAKEPNTARLTGNNLDKSAFATVDLTCKVTWKDETATGAGPRYSSSNWFMYTPFVNGTVNLIAGQHYDAGDVTMSRSGSQTTITITLHSGFRFANVRENVKVQGWNSPPSGNQNVGQFRTHKASVLQSQTSYTFTVGNFNFYGIHVDVQRLLP